jgi:hypothetical protein
MKILLTFFLFSACGYPQDYEKNIFSKKLQSRFVENGYVVSRHLSGDPDYSGERLLWSGITLDAMYCGKEVNMTLLQLQALGIPNQDSKIICALTMAGEH